MIKAIIALMMLAAFWLGAMEVAAAVSVSDAEAMSKCMKHNSQATCEHLIRG